ncbi:MAG: ECF transporter S component [Antricoccus sp.]
MTSTNRAASTSSAETNTDRTDTDRERNPGRSPFSRWQTSDILISAVVGVLFGVVFIFWNNLWAATGPAFAGFPPSQAVIYGIWLVPGVLAPYLTRKAGSGLLAEIVAALVSVIAGGSWSGGAILLYGAAEGLMAEVGFAIVAYRIWKAWVPFLAGATAGIAPAILDSALYYPTWAFGWQLTYGILVIVSSSIMCGVISVALRKTLQASGALPSRRV